MIEYFAAWIAAEAVAVIYILYRIKRKKTKGLDRISIMLGLLLAAVLFILLFLAMLRDPLLN